MIAGQHGNRGSRRRRRSGSGRSGCRRRRRSPARGRARSAAGRCARARPGGPRPRRAPGRTAARGASAPPELNMPKLTPRFQTSTRLKKGVTAQRRAAQVERGQRRPLGRADRARGWRARPRDRQRSMRGRPLGRAQAAASGVDRIGQRRQRSGAAGSAPTSGSTCQQRCAFVARRQRRAPRRRPARRRG